MQIREGYVQVHHSQLAKLLELVELKNHPLMDSKERDKFLAKFRQRLRNKNQDFMSDHGDVNGDQGRRSFSEMSQAEKALRDRQGAAREVQALWHQIGKRVHFQWQGFNRTGVIIGRYYRNKYSIVVDMDGVIQFGGFINPLLNGKGKTVIPVSCIKRDNLGRIITN
jgi:hypothetical protein